MKISKVCRFIDNDQGFVHTLEAIMGIFIIIGVLLFATGGFPYMTQKTGEHSKVQLVNIGRDALDIIELTPVTNIFGNYSRSAGVYRQYFLVANKTFVSPGENINFTVYYIDTNQIVYKNLTLEQTILGLKSVIGTKPINGSTIWSFSTIGEYNIRVYEGNPDSPISWSNYVTITVGRYFLHTDVDGISENGSKVVDGIVYDVNNFGVPDMAIQILDYKYDLVNSSVANTSSERIIEDFENIGGWVSNKNFGLNTIKTQGSFSISVDSSDNSNFYLKKTDILSYKLLRYDNLSFDFFSDSIEETINVELSKNGTDDKIIWRDMPVQNTGWNKIKIVLMNPDIILGNLSIQDIIQNIDTINISINVNSGSGIGNYLFDNLIVSAGSFSFMWPISGPGTTGTYYIQAMDSSGNISNRHRIIYSAMNGGIGFIYSTEEVIYETDSTEIILIPNTKSDKFQNSNSFNINQKFYNNYDTNKIHISDPISPGLKVIFTANTSGDYYIFFGNTGQGGQGQGDPAAAAKTNTILIRVLPFQSDCIFGSCKVKCAGLDMDELNTYMRLFIPYYINYNMYLITPDGRLCTECPEFQETINSYPTDEAVTVNKILHIKTIKGEGLRELRMTLWYK